MIDRDALLAKCKKEWSDCDRCRLKKYRTKTVFGHGQGSAPYKLLIIGEAPGSNEDEKGVPFCGRAGQLLGEIAKLAEVDRKQIFITDLVACRPYESRTPLFDEIAACHERLKTIVLLTRPQVILLLGGAAMTATIGKGKVGTMRGKWHESKWRFPGKGVLRVPTIGTYHPAHALRDPTSRPFIEKDLAAAWQKAIGRNES